MKRTTLIWLTALQRFHSGSLGMRLRMLNYKLTLLATLTAVLINTVPIRTSAASSLYIAYLRPQSNVASPGSGTAMLRLSDDQTYATISFQYSDLSSPVTGIHIHGPADPGDTAPILFDLDAITPQADGTYNWTFTPTDANSVTDIVNAIEDGRIYFNVHTVNFSSGEISGFFGLSTGSQTIPIPTPPPPLASGTPTPQDAARFLSQATFGATDPLISQVQGAGFEAFLEDQFATPMSSYVAFVNANPPKNIQPFQRALSAWWTYAVMAPDQLRQRVAFALSEFFVVSQRTANLGSTEYALPAYMDLLASDAFGNFRQLLQDVTLNPAMGRYLNVLKNDMGDPATGRQPNENYAREVMQLFSIGLYELNLDGSLKLDSNGLPISTYSQNDVIGLANVFTGWTYAQPGAPISWGPVTPDWFDPMVNVASHHSPDSKHILDSVVIPAGQTADQDLQIALDTIFNHPNVAPFVCSQMIQRLVTSNPSPGYVYRVASVFNDNGQGVRGDLEAVIRAILMDYDARGAPKTEQGAGRLREPVIRLTTLFRAFNASTSKGTLTVHQASTSLGEEPMNAPTVFNFFSPDYAAPGQIAQGGLKSPEFQITTETTVATTTNYVNDLIFSGGVKLNLSYDQMLAAQPAMLIDHLNSLLMAGNMSSAMRTTLINCVTQIGNPAVRVQMAIYLILNSPEFVVDK